MITQKDKELWIENLTNGKYEQGRGKLYDGNSNTYCCLGVYLAQQGIDVNQLDVVTPKDSLAYRFLRNELGYNIVNDLIALNDIDRYDFPRIAKWIEKHVLCDK